MMFVALADAKRTMLALLNGVAAWSGCMRASYFFFESSIS
jgi:hypothetical protein